VESLITGRGGYQAFLDRWRYTEEQRWIMRQALNEVISSEIKRLLDGRPSSRNQTRYCSILAFCGAGAQRLQVAFSSVSGPAPQRRSHGGLPSLRA
jgi:hypothetical protein